MTAMEATLDVPVTTSFEPTHVPHKKLVIMAWSGDLDKIWPSFILGTTGAAMGMETTIFFTFWGLFPLVRNDVHITGENWMQKMMSSVGGEPVHLAGFLPQQDHLSELSHGTGWPSRPPRDITRMGGGASW